MSPSRRSALAGSPCAFSESTATSTTVRLTSAAEYGRRSIRSAGLKRPGPGTTSGSPAPPGIEFEGDVRAGPGDGRQDGAGRQQLHAPEGLVVAVAEPRREQPEAGLDATERRPDEGLGPTVDEEHDPAVAGDAMARPRRASGPSADACQPHGARIAGPDRAASGSPTAASEPSVQAVAQ